MVKTVVLAKYGEIALRGKNRRLYENRIMETFRENLSDLDGYEVFKEQGRIVIGRKEEPFDTEAVLQRIRDVTGLVGFCSCIQTDDQGIERLKDLALSYIARYDNGQPFSFKIETRRADKTYPMDSQKVSAEIGGYICNHIQNISVDVRRPDVKLFVELRNAAYIYAEYEAGVGGLPAGASGRGMLLLSGGIDSPAAGFLMAKRGVALSAVYFHSPPFTSQRAEEKVHDLARQLKRFMGSVKLYVVPFTQVQTYLHEHVPEVKLTIFLKRAMLAIASRLAQTQDCHCIITGDSVGQVASQTLEAILAVNTATHMPIIRPLAGLDKQEIIDLAKKIGTYEISIRPYEDCCTIFVAKHPETRPKASVIEGMEKRLAEYPMQIEEAVQKVAVYEF